MIMNKEMKFRIEWDMKNEKAKKYFKDMTKNKKLTELSFNEMMKCSVPALLKSFQDLDKKKSRLKTGAIKKWQASYDIPYALILDVLNNPIHSDQKGIIALLQDKQKITEMVRVINNTFQKTFNVKAPLFDALIKSTGSPFIDGRKRRTFPEIQSLSNKAQKEPVNRDRDKLNKIIAKLQKIEGERNKIKRKDILGNGNPYISAQEMINYQAQALFNCVRKYIDRLDWNDKMVHGIIAELFNRVYGAKYHSSDVKTFIKNAASNISPKK